jgi:flagellar basal-body rod protein FlgG
MQRGIYTAATGMLAHQYVQDAIASNIANANTVGFKQDVPTFKSFQEVAMQRLGGAGGRGSSPVGSMVFGVEFDESSLDLTIGSLEHTRNPLDVAIAGQGFFVVQTPRGERYTRNGQFQTVPGPPGPDGKQTALLADASGNLVMGQKGPINLGAGGSILIDQTGRVFVNNQEADRLRLVDAPAQALVKEGGNLLSSRQPVTPITTRVQQGYLEQSNVSPIGTMVQMITIQRAYESAQKAITAQDDSLGKLINEIGRS